MYAPHRQSSAAVVRLLCAIIVVLVFGLWYQYQSNVYAASLSKVAFEDEVQLRKRAESMHQSSLQSISNYEREIESLKNSFSSCQEKQISSERLLNECQETNIADKSECTQSLNDVTRRLESCRDTRYALEKENSQYQTSNELLRSNLTALHAVNGENLRKLKALEGEKEIHPNSGIQQSNKEYEELQSKFKNLLSENVALKSELENKGEKQNQEQQRTSNSEKSARYSNVEDADAHQMDENKVNENHDAQREDPHQDFPVDKPSNISIHHVPNNEDHQNNIPAPVKEEHPADRDQVEGDGQGQAVAPADPEDRINVKEEGDHDEEDDHNNFDTKDDNLNEESENLKQEVEKAIKDFK